MLKKTFESHLDIWEIKPVNPQGNQSWMNWSWNFDTLATWCEELTHWKDLDSGKDWRWEEKGMAEDVMVGWHYWLDGHEFEQAPGVCDGQGSLALCCSPWGRKELDMTERLNWTELIYPDVVAFWCANLGRMNYSSSYLVKYGYSHCYEENLSI